MLAFPATAIALPMIIGAIVLIIPKRWRHIHESVAIATAFAVLVLTWICFVRKPFIWPSGSGASVLLRVDNLSGFVALFTGLFGVLVTLYSTAFMKGRSDLNVYYAYLLGTLGASIGAAFSNNLLLLLGFWGFLGFTLYILISLAGAKSAPAAKKTFIIVGGSDAVMLLGIAVIWHLTGRVEMDALRFTLNKNIFEYVAFLCLAIGAFAKAGAMPLHTWIPDSGEVAPVPVTAFIPAALDKLLGIYLLARLTLEMFAIAPNSSMSVLLMAIGAITIIAAVMMALVQHNLKRLLAYHAVSQVGYMVLGIGTALPIGIAGGLFHMVNNALYKTCLFLSGGSVEKQAGTAELDKLGGLARFMPVTFTACLIAVLSISGVPPFNGFFSKWMIYQSLIESGKGGAKLWIVWLTIAMFGSALTLASFMKLIFSTFLSSRSTGESGASLKEAAEEPGLPGTGPAANKEVPATMWLPQIALAALCVIFGVFAVRIPLKYFIWPGVKDGLQTYPGIWRAPLATMLMLAGLAAGSVFFLISLSVKKTRRVDVFAGGSALEDNSGIKAASFYDTVKQIPILGAMYGLAEKKTFDIYEEGSRLTFAFTDALKWLHNGVLPTYMIWCLMGMLALFAVFFIR